MAVIKLKPGLERALEAHAAVTAARVAMARRISSRAQAMTYGSRARASHRVEVDLVQAPPLVAAVYGEGDAWIAVFEELGGQGFRPPRAALRRAGRAESNYRERAR